MLTYPSIFPSLCPLQIKDRVYKNRIRVKDFFADFDKLRCGSVTEAQVRVCTSLTLPLPTNTLPPFLSPLIFFFSGMDGGRDAQLNI